MDDRKSFERLTSLRENLASNLQPQYHLNPHQQPVIPHLHDVECVHDDEQRLAHNMAQRFWKFDQIKGVIGENM